MAVKTVTTHVCDRCGRESETPDFNDGNRSGSSVIDVEGREGCKGHDGAWGGSRFARKSEICFSCAREFRDWFENFMTSKEADRG